MERVVLSLRSGAGQKRSTCMQTTEVQQLQLISSWNTSSSMVTGPLLTQEQKRLSE